MTARWAEYERLVGLDVSPVVADVLAGHLDRTRAYGGRRILHEREHGTPRGYQQHRHLGLPACDPCLDAHAEHQNPGGARLRPHWRRNVA